jgi:uncharacterized membrane protein
LQNARIKRSCQTEMVPYKIRIIVILIIIVVLVEIVVVTVMVDEMVILVVEMLTIRTFPNLETVRTKDLLLWFLVQ